MKKKWDTGIVGAPIVCVFNFKINVKLLQTKKDWKLGFVEP